MNIVFSLVLLLGGQEYVIDYNMTEQDCEQRMEAMQAVAPDATFECIWELSV